MFDSLSIFRLSKLQKRNIFVLKLCVFLTAILNNVMLCLKLLHINVSEYYILVEYVLTHDFD